MILASRSFGRRVHERREMEKAVTTHMARAAEKLRRQNPAAGRVVVFIYTDKHRPEGRQYAAERAVDLVVASADTGPLNASAMLALDALWWRGYEHKKASVMLLNLVSAFGVQGGLFDRPDDARSIARMKALDALNAKYGRGTVTFAGMGRKPGWKLRTDFVSPRYTTAWEEAAVGVEGTRREAAITAMGCDAGPLRRGRVPSLRVQTGDAGNGIRRRMLV